jgi:PP-loop superfamily ATP-utilizing enzyme
MDRDYYVAELREAERLLYRAQCRVRCLEANLDRIDPEDFEPLMESLEAARQEATDAGFREVRARIALHDCEKKLSSAGSTEQP